ncbi:MAG: sugar phosphate isomerase/epimerase [Clostridia bacterium]|nr:sugar phosphate isomerase/epimerase [Clostridia bacterium]
MNSKNICINVGMNADVSEFDQIEIIKAAGFDGVFFDWERTVDRKREITKAINLGLELQSFHAPFYGMDDIFHADDTLSDKMLNDIIGTIDCASEYGTNLIICHAIIGMDNHSPNDLGIKRLERVIEYAEKKKIRIAFENTEGIEYLQKILDAYGELPHIGFCFDSGHELCYNGAEDTLAKFGKYLFSTHLNDNMGQTGDEITFYDDSHLLPFDHGVADWNGIAERLHRCNFNGPLTFELVCKNRPERNVSDRYEKMTFEEYINEAFERADRFRKLYNHN